MNFNLQSQSLVAIIFFVFLQYLQFSRLPLFCSNEGSDREYIFQTIDSIQIDWMLFPYKSQSVAVIDVAGSPMKP